MNFNLNVDRKSMINEISSEDLNLNDIDISSEVEEKKCEESDEKNEKSFLLFDESETICVKSEDEFLINLKTNDKYAKCVSIFGNTGNSYLESYLNFQLKILFNRRWKILLLKPDIF